MRMVDAMLKPFLHKSGWRGRLHPKNMENGGAFLRKIGRVVENTLSLGEADRVFGLMDLYGTVIPYPAGLHVPEARAEYLQNHLKRLVPETYRPHFHPHVAVHELEAWLLADESGLIGRLRHSVPPWPNPEKVNFDKPPAAHVNELFRRHLKMTYGKAVDGGRLFGKINPDIVMNKCPHFKLFIDDLMTVTS